ncbi:hypothetical protein ACFQ09_13460 [Massilia norwichensis]|uniref:Uncharacterized protein n=1 Tax=Massilia norwichensis TaxID=1442366 RepID=A0ABT2A6C9_9BURK|nr:hypothetical protein [Massilia norwichensis]MCS0589743.1 hypothetical protein [Massilia norwichensis]
MEKLIAELTRLYLAPEAVTRDALAAHIAGKTTLAIKLTTADGLTRAFAIPFRKVFGDGEAGHWDRLCEVANALQADLGLPAPAVSIDGASAYRLWLSLETPVPAGEAQEFLELLQQTYFRQTELAPDAATAPVYLPPCLNPRSGKWAAFIHPGMGASFAEESGLEVAPPLAGQAAFLEGLDSIADEQFREALHKLEQRNRPATAAAPAMPEPVSSVAADALVAEPFSLQPPPQAPAKAPAKPKAAPASPPDGLLLKDATLEDIVRHLHAKNIEPTFRFIHS